MTGPKSARNSTLGWDTNEKSRFGGVEGNDGCGGPVLKNIFANFTNIFVGFN